MNGPQASRAPPLGSVTEGDVEGHHRPIGPDPEARSMSGWMHDPEGGHRRHPDRKVQVAVGQAGRPHRHVQGGMQAARRPGPDRRSLREATEAGIDRKDAVRLTDELKRKGDLYEPKHGYISRVGGEPRPGRKAAGRQAPSDGDYHQDHWPAGG